MKIGPMVPQSGPLATRELILRVARTAEDAGYDALWVNDHVVYPREFTSTYPYSPTGRPPRRVTVEGSIIEALTLLTFVAAVTERVELGTAILVVPMRQPVLLAKTISSLDHLAGGRLVLGAGIGWAQEEFEVLSAPWERRGARFDEQIRLMRALWTQQWVDGFDGDFYKVDGWTSQPQPPRHVPILIGGHGPRQMRRIGELADGWLTHANRLDTIQEDFQPARDAAAAAGRDPDSLIIAITGLAFLQEGGLEEAAERLHRAKEAGVNYITLGVRPSEMERGPELLEAFAARYLPELQRD